MKQSIHRYFTYLTFLAMLLVLLLCSCKQDNSYQGYIEGDLTYIASRYAGRLVFLPVKRGDIVKPGDLLFKLERQPELASVEQAIATVAQLQSTLLDLTKGQRPSELAAIKAQIAAACAQLQYASIQLKRRRHLVAQAGVAQEQLDQAIENFNTAQANIKQLRSNYTTATLGSRIDQIAAARHQLAAGQAQLRSAQWSLAQKTMYATIQATVFDRYYYEGEQVPAEQPVLSLLDPRNIKAIFYVPERHLASLKVGDHVTIRCDHCQPIQAVISFISPQAEYTPPVIYSQTTRTKLRYRVEARFALSQRAYLHPGQPIDVTVNCQ